jgi:hypothetical protein
MESRAAVAGPTPPWPADRVELWPTETLIPYANNPRLHSAADIERDPTYDRSKLSARAS